MRNNTKTFVVFLILMLAASIFYVGCSEDIVLEPLPTLLGDYEGRFIVTENVGSTNQVTHEFDIRWRFSDQSYWMFDDLDQGVCLPSGDYTLTGEVTMKQQSPGPSITCDASFNPSGVFSLRQPGDSVIMTQQVDNMKKELRLKRLNN